MFKKKTSKVNDILPANLAKTTGMQDMVSSFFAAHFLM